MLRMLLIVLFVFATVAVAWGHPPAVVAHPVYQPQQIGWLYVTPLPPQQIVYPTPIRAWLFGSHTQPYQYRYVPVPRPNAPVQ